MKATIYLTIWVSFVLRNVVLCQGIASKKVRKPEPGGDMGNDLRSMLMMKHGFREEIEVPSPPPPRSPSLSPSPSPSAYYQSLTDDHGDRLLQSWSSIDIGANDYDSFSVSTNYYTKYSCKYTVSKDRSDKLDVYFTSGSDCNSDPGENAEES